MEFVFCVEYCVDEDDQVVWICNDDLWCDGMLFIGLEWGYDV